MTLAKVARAEIAHHVTTPAEGNLALANDPAPVTVTKGDERPALIEVLVTGLVVCLAEMKSGDCDKRQFRRSLVELRNLARNNNITAEEIIGELAKRVGVSLDFVLIAREAEEPEDEVVAMIRECCPSIPEVRPQGRGQDPHRFIADDDLDGKTGRAHERFVSAEGASDLYVTTRHPAGMTGGKDILRDPESGRFISIV